MSRPILLDLYCGAGGAAEGYHRAGFEVVGVDIAEQPRYPFEFIRADVTTLKLPYFALALVGASAIHASPPCQVYSRLAYYQPETIAGRYADLIEPTREMLRATGLPYVIENVPRAPLLDPIELCGCMFTGLMLYRPRVFETNVSGIWCPEHPPHTELCARNGYLPTADRPRMTITGGKHSRAWQRKACEVMGVPWMAIPADADYERTRQGIRELCESIPPLYTQHIGSQLLGQLMGVAA